MRSRPGFDRFETADPYTRILTVALNLPEFGPDAPRPPSIRTRLAAWHRRRVFKRAMRQFLRDPLACAERGSAVLGKLVYGWGNEGWSANDDYLAVCIQEACRSDGPILECGSGLTTLLVAAAALRRGRPYLALEHDPAWGARVRQALNLWGLQAVDLRVNPLKNYGDFDWYDPPRDDLPETLALVICDGPPGDTRGGRYGLLPVLGDRLRGGATILLDDIVREGERQIAARWREEAGWLREDDGPDHCYYRIVVPVAGNGD